jgi:TPR repeat protein
MGISLRSMVFAAVAAWSFAAVAQAPSNQELGLKIRIIADSQKLADAGNYGAAAAMLLPLAERGDDVAQNLLGVLYRVGSKDLPRDEAQSVAWFRKAAEKGNPSSLRHMGAAYDKGAGVPKDPAAALDWYRKAAEKGDGAAQLIVGRKYASGEGLPLDNVQAYRWMTLAAAATYSDGEAERRAEATKSRTAVAAKMTPEQINEAQKMVRERGTK